MEHFRRTSGSRYKYCESKVLARAFSSIAKAACVRFDALGVDLTMGTQPADAQAPRCTEIASRIDAAPGKLCQVQRIEVDDALVRPAGTSVPADAAFWHAFAATFENGSVDYIFICIEGQEAQPHLAHVLKTIWTTLREDCLAETARVETDAAASALMWMVSEHASVGVLVLDEHRRVLDVNESGRELLGTGRVLRERGGILTPAQSVQEKALQEGVKACLTDGHDRNQEIVLFLDSADGQGRRPISLKRFDGGDRPLVVAIVPRQPERARIEKLALKMGLTQSEARVAALMQEGLTNRDAAGIAGLKEQTFITYSKRVLAKLNVGCRAEMAHLLTWQACTERTV